MFFQCFGGEFAIILGKNGVNPHGISAFNLSNIVIFQAFSEIYKYRKRQQVSKIKIIGYNSLFRLTNIYFYVKMNAGSFRVKLSIFCLVFFCLSVQAFSQEETTVEQEYLNKVKNAAILEMVNSRNRNSQHTALRMIDAMIANSQPSDEMIMALRQLAGEGVSHQSRTEGRLDNNYTDIRMAACEILGKIKTKASKDCLIDVVLCDNDPAVIGVAVRSLGEIGINENDETVEAIAWTLRKFDTLNPSSGLALDILFVIEKFFPTVKKPNTLVGIVVRIMNNHAYVHPVRQKAEQMFLNWSK